MVELLRKTGQRGLLIASYKEAQKKDSDRAINPAVEAVHIPAHLAPPGSCKPSSCTVFMLNSHWAELPQVKKVLHLCAQGCFGSVQLITALRL